MWAPKGGCRNYAGSATPPQGEPETVFRYNFLVLMFPILPLKINAAGPTSR
jgi:hypothetical protein